MTYLASTRTLNAPLRRAPLSVLEMLRLHRSRRALAELDDAALLDIGVTRAQADAEARRPFWDHSDAC
ncbi:DUF1127 domain-containing protein [Roseovarius aestuarii]|nr:DUF1127 domain-containing protein [Roseovarius aestuarii]